MTSFIKKNWFFLLIAFILVLAFIITLIVYDSGEETPGETTPGTTTSSTPGSSESQPSSTSYIGTGSDTSGTSVPVTTPPETTPVGPSAVLPAKDIQTETRSVSLTYKDRVVVTANIEYPKVVVDGENEVANRINQVFLGVADKYNGYANENIYTYGKEAVAANDPSLPYWLNVHYATKYNSRTVLSVVFTIEVFTGGTSQHTSAIAYNVGADGSQLTLSSLFRVNQATYSRRIWDEVIALIGDNAESFYADYKDLIKTIDLEGRLYFTGEGMHVIYNPYEIAPYAEGILDFTIPYEKVSDILAINPLY